MNNYRIDVFEGSKIIHTSWEDEKDVPSAKSKFLKKFPQYQTFTLQITEEFD